MGKSMDKRRCVRMGRVFKGGSRSCELVGKSRNSKRSKATELQGRTTEMADLRWSSYHLGTFVIA